MHHESWKSRLARWGFNLHPAFRGTGGRVVHLRHDFRHVRIAIPSTWRTRNPFGVTFGGSLFGAIDPICVPVIAKTLGRGYIVWDKAASIQFKRPAKDTLYADFHFSEGEEHEILNLLRDQAAIERSYTIDLHDRHGKVHVSVEKVVYIANKEHYLAKLAQRQEPASNRVPETSEENAA